MSGHSKKPGLAQSLQSAKVFAEIPVLPPFCSPPSSTDGICMIRH